jgi:hypothetical protein
MLTCLRYFDSPTLSLSFSLSLFFSLSLPLSHSFSLSPPSRLLSNLNNTIATCPLKNGVSSRSDGSSDFSTFLDDLCGVSESLKIFPLSSAEKGHTGDGIGLSRNGQCTLLPLVLSPSYLAAMLLAGGFFSPAAHIHWTIVVRRPVGLYTADAAASLLFAHMSSAALPIYLSSPAAPEEVVEQTWGWALWGAVCHNALHT